MAIDPERARKVAEIFKRSYWRLRNDLRPHLGAQTDDRLQDCFTYLLSTAKPIPSTNPEGFIFTMTRNLGIDCFRRLKRQLEHAKRTIVDTADEKTPERTTLATKELELLDRALDRLAVDHPRAHAVFVRSRRDGLKVEELAREFGIAEYTVRKDVSRALKYCKQALDQPTTKGEAP